MVKPNPDTHGGLAVALCTLLGFVVVAEMLMASLIGQLGLAPSWTVSLLGAAVIALMPFPVLYVAGSRKLAAHRASYDQELCALRRSERRFKQAQLIAGLGSYELDLSRDRWTSSDALDSILGISGPFDRSLGSWFSLVHPNWQEMVERLHRDVVRGSCGRFDLEYEIIRESDAQARWVHCIGHVERDDWDRPVMVVGTLLDVTERKRAESALRLRGEALNAAAHAIVIADRHGTIQWVNKALTDSTGYESSEAIGRNPRELFKSGAQDAAFYAGIWKTLLKGGVWRGEMVNRRKDGTQYVEDVAITPIKNDQGVPTHFIAVKQDVTERKKLEQQFLRTQRLESIGLLAGGIAHDLNNVLAPILMSADLLKLTAVEADRPLLNAIGTSAQRGADMIKGVLSFARGLKGSPVTVQLRHLIREIESMTRETFPKSIRVSTAVDRNLWTLTGDPTQLHQMLLNLCINSRDAMQDGGQLLIAADNVLQEAKPYVRVQVRDTGTGIAPEIVERIFDPFFTTKQPGEGTGLGLSTLSTIVKSHGGFVRVSSTPGEGACFQVFLPAEPDSDDPRDVPAIHELPRGQGETVLVVDDEAAIREISRQTLEAFGYRVLLASHGAEAVTLYAERIDDVAVVVTDLMMPCMDGATTIQLLKKMNPRVRIIAVTGQDLSGTRPSFDADVVTTLSKPYSPEALLNALRDAVAEQCLSGAG